MLRNASMMVLVVSFFTGLVGAAELDQGYVKAFGWGSICASERGMPAKDRFDASMFTYQQGKFMVSAGGDKEINFRALLKDGKTYGHYLNALKKANADKMKTYKENYTRYTFWVSHDLEGQQIFDTWPTSLNMTPKWSLPLFNVESGLTSGTVWNGSACSWQMINEVSGKLRMFLEHAQPGWRIYVNHEAGFIRSAPELKYWDKDVLRHVTPIQYVSTGPLAACTIEVMAAPQ